MLIVRVYLDQTRVGDCWYTGKTRQNKTGIILFLSSGNEVLRCREVKVLFLSVESGVSDRTAGSG